MIFKQINGPMKPTIPLPCKCFQLGFSRLLDLSKLEIPTTFLTFYTSSFFAQNVFSKIADYAVASTASAAFIIGGYDAVDVFSTLSTVAEFSQLPSELAGSWKRRGDLQRARADHKAITYLGQTFVIGSWPYPRFVSE